MSIVIKLRWFLRDLLMENKARRARQRYYFGEFNRDKWELTNDFVGVREKEPILCPIDGTRMIIRKSFMERSNTLNYQNAVFDLYFKCPSCSLVLNFGIAVPEHHYQRIRLLRKKSGIGMYYVPVNEWKTNDEIKKRLEELGYW